MNFKICPALAEFEKYRIAVTNCDYRRIEPDFKDDEGNEAVNYLFPFNGINNYEMYIDGKHKANNQDNNMIPKIDIK